MPRLATAFRRESQTAGAQHELLSPCAFAGNAVLTKRGDIFQALHLAPMDAECLEPEAVGKVCARFESAFRTLGPDFRVYQYLIKRTARKLELARSSDDLQRSRAVWLNARRGELYEIEIYLVILRHRPLSETPQQLLARWSMRKWLEVSRESLDRDVEILGAAVHSVTGQLHELLRPESCDRKQTLHFLRSLVNTSGILTDVSFEPLDFHVDQQMTMSRLQCWPRYLKQDDDYIRLLSLVEPPAQTFPHLLRSLLAVPCNMIMCAEWKRETNETARKHINKYRRHYHLAKSSMLSYAGNSSPRPDEVLLDDSKTAVVDELNAALKEIELNENFFGHFALTIALWHRDNDMVSQCVPKVFEAFAAHDAKLVEETYNMVNAWAAMVPGNYEYSLRQMWLLNVTWSHLSFLFAPASGSSWNEHLRSPCLAAVETREGTLYYMNLHVQDVAHTVLLGSTGSGKTFLLNFLISAYQQYSPYTVIFDLMGNYRRLTAQYNGGYLYAARPDRFIINPFCLPPTTENLEFLFCFVRVLLEHGNPPLNPGERKDLYSAITDVYALEPPVRRLSSLMVKRTCARRLDEWAGSGRLAGYFDNVEDTLTLRRFQTFDFQGMDKPEVLEPLLFYILHRVSATITAAGQKHIPKLVVCDEAWKFFKNPVTRDYIHQALKTWRNLNAAVVLATQSGDDLLRSELLPTVAESCMSRIFLANPGMDSAVYRDAFNLNAAETEHIAHLIPKRQFLLKRPDSAKVLNLFVDPESYRVFSNNSEEKI
jgi:type IV secretion system protein VirB4